MSMYALIIIPICIAMYLLIKYGKYVVTRESMQKVYSDILSEENVAFEKYKAEHTDLNYINLQICESSRLWYQEKLKSFLKI